MRGGAVTRLHRRGFTLIELLVVIAVIAVLSAVVTPNAFRAIEKAKVAAFAQDFKAVSAALHSLYADTGVFPAHYEDMRYPLITGGNGWAARSGWDGPYLEKYMQYYWGGGVRGPGAVTLTLQNSCADRGKDWDGDIGCEIFACYQPEPPVEAQARIDWLVDGGDGPAAGMMRSRITCWSPAHWCGGAGGSCFWPGFINE